MPQHPLSELLLKSLKASGAQTRYFDERLPGFGVRVGKRAKTFIVMVGRERRVISIGEYPSMSLADARAKAKLLLATPDAHAKDASPLFADARALFIETHTSSERHKNNLKRLLTKHFGALDHLKLSGITTGQIDAITDALRSRPSECLHAWRAARTLFRWCVRRRLITTSPLADTVPPTEEKVGDRVLSDTEIKTLWQHTADGNHFSLICRLLLITGQRRAQIGSLRSEWITEDGILFPASIMKAGREHLIPITPLVASMIPQAEGCLFAARRRDTPFSGYSASKLALDKRSQIRDWGLHSLRRTAATNWGKLAVQPHVIQSLLSHAWGGVTARYNRFDYFKEKKDALELWEKRLQEIVAT